MLYVIVCLINDEAHDFHEELVRKVCDKFKVKRQKLQSHFTIKAPFETNQIEVIDNLTEVFCQKYERASFSMENYGHFNDRVAYMKINASREMKDICSSYLTELKTIPWLEWKRNENKQPIFHCTIVSKLPSGKFSEIWPFLTGLPYKFYCHFDNITIMRWNGDEWTIHKSFSLKLKER